jgi:hypothetical protein
MLLRARGSIGYIVMIHGTTSSMRDGEPSSERVSPSSTTLRRRVSRSTASLRADAVVLDELIQRRLARPPRLVVIGNRLAVFTPERVGVARNPLGGTAGDRDRLIARGCKPPSGRTIVPANTGARRSDHVRVTVLRGVTDAPGESDTNVTQKAARGVKAALPRP